MCNVYVYCVQEIQVLYDWSHRNKLAMNVDVDLQLPIDNVVLIVEIDISFYISFLQN